MSSVDLLDWDIDVENPMLSSGFSYDRLGFLDASIVRWWNEETREETLFMFYVGFSDEIDHGSYREASNMSLGLAISSDGGISWEKDANNPFPIQQTDIGKINSVEARRVGSRILLWVGDAYTGASGIGYFFPSKVPFLNGQSPALLAKITKVPMFGH